MNPRRSFFPLALRAVLNSTLQQLTNKMQSIQRLPTKFGTEIRDNELLNSVRQRTAISGGTCGFDLPAYHYWLNQPHSLKSQRFARWLSEVEPLKNGIELILNLFRTSALFEKQTAEAGFFQRSFDLQSACQLLRILLPNDSIAFPEVSGNKLRVNIRFLTYNEITRPKQINFPLEFELSCCAI